MTGRTSLGSIFAGVGALAVLAGVRLPLIRTGPLPGDLRWTAVYRPGADPGLAGPYDLLVVALLVALVGGRWLATSWLAPSGVGRLVAATVTAGGGAGIGLVALWYAHASGYLNLFGIRYALAEGWYALAAGSTLLVASGALGWGRSASGVDPRVSGPRRGGEGRRPSPED